MSKTTKKAAETIPVIFGWKSTKDGHPAVKKHTDVYSISGMLLLHSNKYGRTPGYFVKYDKDHLAATPPRQKGDTVYHAADGTVLTDVKYFFETKDIPAPKEPTKQATE